MRLYPKSLLGKAIKYTLGQKEAIDKLLEYGEIDISNNTCEQAVKSLIIDRKNFCLVQVWQTLM